MLDSKYLLDLYPKPPATGGDKHSSFASTLERNRYLFYQRKVIPFACQLQHPNGSLIPFVLSYFKRKEERLQHTDTNFCNCVTVPPNVLVFEMLWEALMGYNL